MDDKLKEIEEFFDYYYPSAIQLHEHIDYLFDVIKQLRGEEHGKLSKVQEFASNRSELHDI